MKVGALQPDWSPVALLLSFQAMLPNPTPTARLNLLCSAVLSAGGEGCQETTLVAEDTNSLQQSVIPCDALCLWHSTNFQGCCSLHLHTMQYCLYRDGLVPTSLGSLTQLQELPISGHNPSRCFRSIAALTCFESPDTGYLDWSRWLTHTFRGACQATFEQVCSTLFDTDVCWLCLPPPAPAPPALSCMPRRLRRPSAVVLHCSVYILENLRCFSQCCCALELVPPSPPPLFFRHLGGSQIFPRSETALSLYRH